MEFPESFRALAMNVLLIYLGEKSGERDLEDFLQGIDLHGRKELLDYLTGILDGRYDDEQLEALWFNTGTDVMLRDPRDTRRFLTALRDELAKEADRERR